MRDWYGLGQLVLMPAAATVGLHLLLLAILLVRWQPSSEARTIEARVAQPQMINATLVDAASLKPKPAPAKPAPAKPAPKVAKPQSAPKAAPKAAPKTVPKKPAPTPVTKPKPKPAQKPPPEPRISAEELAAISRRELAAKASAEQALQAAATAEQMSASYAGLIRNTVANYWSRPPSARNGMEALLAIQLIPTGDIVSVSVLRSSGSTAFDRSALNAVEKAGRFPELQNLPSQEFEKNFRRFQLLFRPEDLRY